MRYGRFSPDGREFIIDNVDTPAPWINYLYNGRYFTFVSGNGGGMSYIRSPLHGRVTRYRINDVPSDRPGKYVYVRDRDTGKVWTLTWQPVGRDRERYTAAHGFGYTRVEAEIEGIASSVTYFVPPDADLEVWKCTLTNRTDKPRTLSLYGYVELCLGHAHVDLINQCDDQHFNRVHFDRALNALLATKTYWVTEHAGTQQQENKAWDHHAFFTSSEPVVQYETLRERFIGRHLNEGNPLALEEGELTSRDTDYGNAVGALRVDVTLEPGASREVIFNLGVFAEDQGVVGSYRSIEETDAGLERVHARWNGYFDTVKVTTPDSGINTFLNHWLPYQARVAFDVGRVASYYYWGISRGFGFRDTAQDTLAVTASDPGLARNRIRLLARQMFSTGKVYHHFTAEGHGETTGHCDDPFWFILAVTDYIKETGDTAILDEKEPFLDGKTGTILDHLLAVTRLAKDNLGEHGLPTFGRGDWNDTLDYIGGDEGGESVWGAMFYVAMLNELIDLLDFIGREVDLRPIRDRMASAVEKHCWDGEWFIRAFGGKGRKIGSRECEAGRIFLNAQSWAVIAGIADREKQIQSMDSVKAHLDTEFGPKICAPAYREIDPSIGLVTRCVAGKKENGAVFCHPVTWCIMAECLLKRGNEAYHYFKKTLPGAVDQDVFCAEPYVYSQYITSDEHDEPGKASHSWQTGTAAWMKRVIIDYMLGVRAGYHGLVVDPVIPAHWKKVTLERRFRGRLYNVDVENPAGLTGGVKAVFVDDVAVSGNVISLPRKGDCRVRVVLGD